MGIRFGVVVLLMGSSMGLAQSPKTPLRVSSGVMAGLLLERPDPVYPEWVRAEGINGAMVIRAIISTTGHVEEVQAISGPEAMRDATMDAIRRWVYRPYLLNGVPQRVDTTITISSSFGGAAPFCGSEREADADFHAAVSSGTMAGLLLKRTDPIFPREAWVQHVSGAPVLRVCIGRDGHVEKIQAISGPEMLRKPYIDAVSKWEYRPYLLNGVAVPVSTVITIWFQMSGLPKE